MVKVAGYILILFLLTSCADYDGADANPATRFHATRYLGGQKFEVISASKFDDKKYHAYHFKQERYQLWGEVHNPSLEVYFYLPMNFLKYQGVFNNTDFQNLSSRYSPFRKPFTAHIYLTPSRNFFYNDKNNGRGNTKYLFHIPMYLYKSNIGGYLSQILTVTYHETFHIDHFLNMQKQQNSVEEEKNAYLVGYCSAIYASAFSKLNVDFNNNVDDEASFNRDINMSIMGKKMAISALHNIKSNGIITKTDVQSSRELAQLCTSVYSQQ